jgi:formylglycine-generating enzyme
MRFITIFFLTFVLVLTLSAQQKKKTLAVLEFQSSGELKKSEIITLSNRFRTMLVKTDAFDIIERDKMNDILKEQNFTMTDQCNTAECAVQIGQLLNVELMIAGDIGQIGETYSIDMRLIDVSTGKITQTEALDYTGKIDGLLGAMTMIANTFAGIKSSSASSDKQVTSNNQNIETTFQCEIDMILVKGGTFNMGDIFGDGDNDEKPVHPVTLNDFWISKNEISVSEYRKFCNEAARTMPSTPSWGWKDDHPIVNVSWEDAKDYCNWLTKKTGKTFRLPYEAEWEYAAKGGNQSKGYKFSGSNKIDLIAWYNLNAGSKTHPAGKKDSNELGIFYMSGNVWEWCEDWYSNNYYSESTKNNPQGPYNAQNRVLRGGSWVDGPGYLRTMNRFNLSIVIRRSDIGFRIVRID